MVVLVSKESQKTVKVIPRLNVLGNKRDDTQHKGRRQVVPILILDQLLRSQKAKERGCIDFSEAH